jgi:hypothetical protein
MMDDEANGGRTALLGLPEEVLQASRRLAGAPGRANGHLRHASTRATRRGSRARTGGADRT